ncbi:MAG: hypothetical protein HPY83_08265 [Anaerolineae bacterium]|nr:hypothetical protein [Anaerolineae bacterium]
MLRIGFARQDITPPLGVPCSLGLDDECQEIFDPPHVRALLLSDGEDRVLLLSTDLIGLQRRNQLDLKRAIGAATGLPEGRILAHATHTHEAPTVQVANNEPLEPYGLVFADPSYYRTFLDRAVAAAQEAVSDTFEVEASWGRGRVVGVASNRRILDEQGRLHWRSSRPPAEARELPEGEIDPWVRVLRLSEIGGPREVLLLNYCCHPTAAGGDEEWYVTADFPGEAMRLLETERPYRYCTYFTGPCGNINPGKYVGDGQEPSDRVRDVRVLGRNLADGVRAALREMEPVQGDGLRFHSRTVRMPLREDLPTRAKLEGQLRAAVEVYRQAQREGRRLPGGGDIRRLAHKLQLLRLTEDGVLPTDVAALRWGSFAAALLPGECFLEIAESLWRQFPDLNLVPVAPIDYSLGYVPTPETFQQGGYEAGVANVSPLGFETLVEAATKALQEVS